MTSRGRAPATHLPLSDPENPEAQTSTSFRSIHLLYVAALMVVFMFLLQVTLPINSEPSPKTTWAVLKEEDVPDELKNSFRKLMFETIAPVPAGQYHPVAHLGPGEQKRILITGGAGFIGSHLTDVLMMRGHLVTVIDNLFTGRRKNIEHWMGHPNFEFIRHDVIEPFMMEVDEIYHLACPASPPHYQYNPIKTIKTNVLGTMNMLGLAKRVRAKILYASTSEVYGDPLEHPQVESYHGNVNPFGPRACYDEGKRVGETLSYEYIKQHDVQVRIVRIFNTYGPRMHPNDGRVVSNFIIQALQNKPITVYGNGEQTRSFQYVSDLVRGLIGLMESNLSEPCNIGNPVETTIKEFATLIQSKISPDTPITYLPATEDDPRKRKPDISRAKEKFGWEPQVTLDEGLEKTIAYFRAELELEDKTSTEPVPTIWMTPY